MANALQTRLAAASGLVHPTSGRAITRGDVAAIRIRASLEPSPDGNINPYSYDSAQPWTREMSAWLPQLRSPDSELNWDRDRMAARARDLVRNDGWARGAINRLLDAMIGSHFFPMPRPNWRGLARQFGSKFDAVWAAEFASAIKSEWRLWANDPLHSADATQTGTVTQLLRLAARSELVEGDSLIFVGADLNARASGLARYATTLMVIDPDRLSNPYHGTDLADRRGGVEIDIRTGAPVGYHVQRAHDYDPYLSADSTIWDYIPRRTASGRPVMVHGFDRERGGQHRGVGVLHAVLGRFRMLNRYDATSLQAAMARATLGFFMTSAQDEQSAMDALSGGEDLSSTEFYQNLAGEMLSQQPVMMNGFRVPVLPPGEKMNMVAGPGHADDYDAFQAAGLRMISAATGQSATEVDNNFKDINYSSFRGSILQAWRAVMRRRSDFAANTATPVYGAFIEEALQLLPDLLPAGVPPDEFPRMRAALCEARWVGSGRGWVDPVKERQGELLGLDAGFGTLEDTCADIEGEDWEERLDQRAIEVAAFKARGLKLPEVYQPSNATEDDKKPQAA